MAQTVLGSAITPTVKPLIINERFLKRLEDKAKSMASLADKSGATDDSKKTAMAWPPRVQTLRKEEVESNKGNELPEVSIEKTDWVITGIVGTLVNILLIVGGYFGYRFFKKKSAQKQEELLNKLTE